MSIPYHCIRQPIIDNVPKELYEVTLVGITTEGKWLHYEGARTKLITIHGIRQFKSCIVEYGRFKGLIKLNERDKVYEKLK